MVILLTKSTNSKMSFVMVQCHHFGKATLKLFKSFLTTLWSIRLGDWDLDQKVSELMLPWFHVYGRQNYAQHFAYCWASRQQLPNTHPHLYPEFKQGNFSVRRSADRFNNLPPDLVKEQTINKDQKGSGGIIGYNISEGKVPRWIITSHVTVLEQIASTSF